ncbi:cupredoxin domain-containing protein [candidate division WS5 bacterium]|uniref:Cupredoxin domain-containing protein n=1 Tax=candidate division WS5 bacterium TaxID=2093353 RepID=A0A419DFJ7_9BACT|nr:MAG: cupredoxin domain-containing protein [candidate division WS5 bacterium]
MDKIIVLITGMGSIVFILWFFLGKKTKGVFAKERVEIKVEGGYSPDKIIVKKGRKTTLVFHRKDPSDCLEEVIIPEFKIRKKLPLGERVEVEITPEKTGEYGFECGMGMFKGKIIVK